MKKRNIVIVEATSTGANYIHDVRELGHNPVCVEMYPDKEVGREYYESNYSLNGEELPQHIKAEKSYEKTLEVVRKLDPICIVPASDERIEWATKRAYDLGLPGNIPKNLNKMIDKQYSQDALKEANLRYIRSKEVTSYEEAKEFIKELDGSKFVVKPSIGQSTVGVCICETDEELKEALEINKKIQFSEDVHILIQEYIGGEEFIIDSICCKGHNRVVSGFVYKKILIEGKGAIYDYAESIDATHPNFKELEEYNEKVLSALGLEYGTTHGEYKIDENGPVLIEMNCRVLGAVQKYTLLDDAWGEHHTAISLESYLDPEACISKANKTIEPQSYYVIKPIIMYDDTYVKKSNIEEVFSNMESFQYAFSFGDERLYPKTIDLHTCGGLVYLLNKDKAKLMEDLDVIRNMEKYEVEKMFDIGEPEQG